MDLFQKTLVGQNVTTGPSMYKCMERVLKGDAKAEFTQQANLVGSYTVGNFTTVMKVLTFNTSLIKLNNYHPYSLLDCIKHMVTALPDDEVKEILYRAMPNWWREKITGHGYNYLDRSIQEISRDSGTPASCKKSN